MITLRDTIDIRASPEQVFDFFVHFREHFMAWHPDHVRCWYLEDGPLREGSTFFVQEYLHTRARTLEFLVTRLVPYSRIEYKISPMVRGVFDIEQLGPDVLFTAEICFGTKAPLLGKVLDRTVHTFMGRRLAALQQHMVEEGRNLKLILESALHETQGNPDHMPSEMPKCKITVLKRTINRDLIDEYLDDSYGDTGLCECFREGEEFAIDPSVVPADFCARCAWAWADIRKDILTVAMGANMPGIRQPGTVITGCTDWLRPVIFKVERIASD